MGIMRIIRNSTWDTIEAANNWLIRTRAGDPAISAQERAGINFSILLNSSCYVEGNLEWLFIQLLEAHAERFHSIEKPHFETRRSVNRFFKRLVKEVDERICRATGPDNYCVAFQLLVGERLSDCAHDPQSWEGIRVLFYLRNVIAHGRMATAKYTMTTGTQEEPEWDAEFKGGYARVCEYLEKRGLASQKFGCHRALQNQPIMGAYR